VAFVVELLGLARVLARQSEVTLSLAPGATLHDVTRALAAAYPALVGPVLTAEGRLAAGTLFSLDGRAVTEDLSLPVPDADNRDHGQGRGVTLLLLTSMEGGA
jgi:hypothetical protein